MLKDFFYLDIDKVKSYVAQLRGGTPESVEATSTQSGKGGAQFVLSASYVYEKSATETRSLHHYLYDLLESDLRASGRLTEIDEGYPRDRWTPDSLADGSFVLTKGRVRVMDWETILAGLEAAPKIARIAAEFGKQSLQQQRKAAAISRDQFERSIKESNPLAPHEKDIKRIVDVVRELYARSIRVKVYPFQDDRERQLVGNVYAEYLQQARTAFFSTSGGESPPSWFVMGVVNQASAPSTLPQQETTGGATFDDALEAVVAAMEQVSQLASGVQYPKVSFTPIAIYRCL